MGKSWESPVVITASPSGSLAAAAIFHFIVVSHQSRQYLMVFGSAAGSQVNPRKNMKHMVL